MDESSFIIMDSVKNQPKVALMQGYWSEVDMVGYFNERNYDWVGSLLPDRELELYKSSFRNVGSSHRSKSNCLRVADLVKSTPKSQYCLVNTPLQTYWCYTQSLGIVGLGRIRFVVYFSNPQKKGDFVAFATNRLDWAPGEVLKHWTQKYPMPILRFSRKVLNMPAPQELQAI